MASPGSSAETTLASSAASATSGSWTALPPLTSTTTASPWRPCSRPRTQRSGKRVSPGHTSSCSGSLPLALPYSDMQKLCDGQQRGESAASLPDQNWGRVGDLKPGAPMQHEKCIASGNSCTIVPQVQPVVFKSLRPEAAALNNTVRRHFVSASVSALKEPLSYYQDGCSVCIDEVVENPEAFCELAAPRWVELEVKGAGVDLVSSALASSSGMWGAKPDAAQQPTGTGGSCHRGPATADRREQGEHTECSR